MNFKLSKDSNIFILICSYFINCSSQVLADFCLDNQQALARVEDHNFVFTISILYFILLYAITQMRKLKEALYLLSHLAITGTAAIWNASTHRDSFPRFLGILWIQWERCLALFSSLLQSSTLSPSQSAFQFSALLCIADFSECTDHARITATLSSLHHQKRSPVSVIGALAVFGKEANGRGAQCSRDT